MLNRDKETPEWAADRRAGQRTEGRWYLWSDKVRRVAGRHQQAVVRPHLLREAEVADAQALGRAAVVGVEDVGRLQVAMHHLDRGKAQCTD